MDNSFFPKAFNQLSIFNPHDQYLHHVMKITKIKMIGVPLFGLPDPFINIQG